jgi:hypothetical protein
MERSERLKLSTERLGAVAARGRVSPPGDNPDARVREDAGPRLAGRDEQPDAAPRRAVARANLLASGMSPLDGRWLMALKVAHALEGGRAAILSPERRRVLLNQARGLGLRDFDANLLIAIVQDGRRSGRGALNIDIEQRLRLLPDPEPGATAALGAMTNGRWWAWALAAMTAGMLIAVSMSAWVAGGSAPVP